MNMLAPALGLILLGTCAAALICAEFLPNRKALYWWALLCLITGDLIVAVWLVSI